MPQRKPELPSVLHKDPRVAVRWVRDHMPEVHLPDVHLPAFRAPSIRAKDVRANGREVAAWIADRLPQPPARRRGPEPRALILPAVLAAASAGAAFYWWTQWSRGRAETLAAEEGAANPEHILDHAPPPPSTGDAPNPSDDRLRVPAEEVLAHAPPPEGAKPKAVPKRVSRVVAPVAETALKNSLAAQASSTPSAPAGVAAKPPA